MVPEGWKVERISDTGNVHAGRQRSPHFVEGRLRPYLRVANVFDGYIDIGDVNEMAFTDEAYERYKLLPGDILLNEGQSVELVGRAAMYQGEPADCCFQNTLIRYQAGDNTDKNYALALFHYCQNSGLFSRIATKTNSIAHLGVSRFADLQLPFPPLPEQKKIAEILSTWDRAIETAEALLATARTQKRALMQTLLTGKRRFPKFEGQEWREVSIGDVAREVSVRNKENAALPVILCSKVVGFVNSLDYFKKQVFSDDLSGYKVISRGQIGYPSNHIEEGSIGIQNLYESALVSPIYTIFEPKPEIDAMFLFRVLKTDLYRQKFAAATNASVDRRGSLRWKAFAQIKVPLPSLGEQKHINAALDAADDEIQVRSEQAEKLRTEKKALMQQLLTGKRRVQV